ncbi:allophanate hydrolase [Methyloligella sp. 2.7D]|uniref:allophanate hydrolase n=1 Tax=unclassified Methyloligella TaxID=2625955 RepID=UPI00157D5A32|nr:allophanate hydrolase [Methyloligella sp. GL2]QKP76904.1 allophanate hydrolase [Methyloligella sp. GL2]
MAPRSLMALAAAHRDGSIDPEQTLAELYEAIAARGDDGVWISVLPKDEALAEVRRQMARANAGEDLPLLGVPFAVKDNIDVAGLATTAGCPAYAYEPEADAFAVAKLREAGALPIGKTNLDQFATGLSGTRTPHTIPHSVFSAEHVSGGSSSGSAVAVGAGLVPFSLGTDTAGSGRVPAGLNNIVGVKPSRGLLSGRGAVPACQSLDCISIFAKTASEADFVRRIAQGLDQADPFSRAPAETGLELERPVIGVPSPESRIFCGDSEAQALYQAALEKAAELGWQLVEIDYTPLSEIAQLLYGGPFVAERYAAVGAFVDAHPDAVNPVVGKIVSDAKAWSAADLFDGLKTLAAAQREMLERWQKIDALLLPTAPTAPTIATMLDDPVRLNSELGTYTNFVNLLDCAAIAVPAGFRPSGMPFGVTLVGPAFSDADLAHLGDRLHRAISPETGGARLPLTEDTALTPAVPQGWIEIAVVGAHLKGQPLNHQLTDWKGRFLRTTRTDPHYRLYALADTTPPKPGLAYDASFEGAGIELEIWALPAEGFGSFTASIPAPLGIGKVSLQDGGTVSGFLCEPRGLDGATEITEFGGWRAYLASRQA